MDIGQWFVEALQGFPSWLAIIIIAMIPLVELRGTILMWGAGVHLAGFPYPDAWLQVYLLSVLGNLIPVPFILKYLGHVERWLRRFKIFDRFFDWLYERTRRRASDKIARYEALGVLVFVAIPLPMTGAWTGSLIAFLFDLKFRRAFPVVIAGVLTAGVIMLVLVSGNLVAAVGMVCALVVASFVLARL